VSVVRFRPWPPIQHRKCESAYLTTSNTKIATTPTAPAHWPQINTEYFLLHTAESSYACRSLASQRADAPCFITSETYSAALSYSEIAAKKINPRREPFKRGTTVARQQMVENINPSVAVRASTSISPQVFGLEIQIFVSSNLWRKASNAVDPAKKKRGFLVCQPNVFTHILMRFFRKFKA